jgi:amidase
MFTRELGSFDLPSLLNITIEKASEGLKSGRFKSVDLVKAYLARIEEAAEFNAILQVNPEALTVAKHLDDERVYSGSRGFVMYPSSSYTLLTITAPCMAFPFW